MNKQQPMKTYTLISFHDGNDTIDIEADNLLDASLDALDSLGWRLNSLEDSTGYKVMLAAHELLSALKALHSCHRAFSGSESWTTLDDEARGFAETAIAKAEGVK